MLIKPHEAESGIHIDFVPMVDVLFCLVVFFLLATTIKQAEREMQIALPRATAGGPISAVLKEIVVNVDAEGKMIVGGRPMAAEDLRTIVKEAAAANPDQKVTVRGDRATAYANVVTVLDICKGSGIQEPYLDTVLEN